MADSAETLVTRYRPWAAAYQPSPIPSYRGNPLIETLAPLRTRDDISVLLQRKVAYDERDRTRPTPERLHLLLGATRFFQPLEHHLDLAETVDAMIREGYVRRNPAAKGYWPRARQKLRSVLTYAPDEEEEETPTSGLTLIGISGIGKSRAIGRALQIHPQVIEYSRYDDHPFSFRQLVYLRLICPPDSSRVGLCKAFFREVDRRMNTHLYRIHADSGRATVDSILIAMGIVCLLLGIGVLVIDEVQNLREARATDAARMLSFFTALDNEIGVPVILIGTLRARAILSGGFTRARRAEGHGGRIWDRMQRDASWVLFLETLWRYQYTLHPCALTDELIRVMYDESQGIADIAIKLYVLTQIRVMMRRSERITAAILRKTARERLPFVQPFLSALRTNDLFRLEHDETFDDLILPKPEDVIREAEQQLAQPGPAVESRRSAAPSSTTPPAELGSAAEAPRAAAADQVDTGPHRGASRARTKRGVPSQGGLLNELVERRAPGTTPYDALKAAGYVCGAEEYLHEEAS